MRASAKAVTFTESVIREMARLAMAHGAINLAQGFPDLACPPGLKAAARAAIDADLNEGAITWRARDFRQAIAARTTRDYPARRSIRRPMSPSPAEPPEGTSCFGASRRAADPGVASVPGSSFHSRPELGRMKIRFTFPKRPATIEDAASRVARPRAGVTVS